MCVGRMHYNPTHLSRSSALQDIQAYRTLHNLDCTRTFPTEPRPAMAEREEKAEEKAETEIVVEKSSFRDKLYGIGVDDWADDLDEQLYPTDAEPLDVEQKMGRILDYVEQMQVCVCLCVCVVTVI
jgi:hypothetical protein